MLKIPQETISLLRDLSCENVAERLGVKVIKHKALCFMHKDHHPSLSFFGKNRERWKCFVCNKGGSTIDFVTEYAGIDFVKACQWLCKEFGIPVGNYSSIKGSIKTTSIKKKQKFENVEKSFYKDVAQWILANNSLTEKGKDFLFRMRRLNASIIKQLNIVSIDNSKFVLKDIVKNFDSKILQDSGFISITNGRSYFRLFTPCLIFPYYDTENELVGMQSRYLGTNVNAPRFQFIFAQKVRLFNLPILNTMNFGDDLYISEGITDCLALLSSGKKAVAIPSSTILPQIDLIKLVSYKLHMYHDRDNAGQQAFLNLRRFFINHYVMIKAEQLPEEVKDYSEYYVMTYGKQRG